MASRVRGSEGQFAPAEEGARGVGARAKRRTADDGPLIEQVLDAADELEGGRQLIAEVEVHGEQAVDLAVERGRIGQRAGAVDEPRAGVVTRAPGRGVVAEVERAAPRSGLEAEAGREFPFRDIRDLVAVARAGEEAVLRHMPQAYIFRPSVVFGPEDQFFNRFASMAQTGPILPFAGAATRFQPVYVDDIAQAVEIALTRETPAGTYELGGPEIIDFAGLMTRMLAVIERRRLLVNIPFFMARPMATGFDFLETVTLRLFKNGILTRDQLKDLTIDNIVSETAKGFSDIDIEPTSLEAILPEYLWCYRPSGQYAAIKSSAKNLNQ